MTVDPMSAFLRNMSIEITGKQIDKLPVLVANLTKATRVFIALIDPADVAAQLSAARQLQDAGFVAVPHIPARFVRDLDNLKSRIGALAQDAGVTEMLVLGGGAPQPVGAYDSAIQILETGVFQANGIRRIGIAGFIATQFLFDAAPVAEWAKTSRAAGIDLPVHVGIPGPATIKTLVKYAAMCGVGNSARFIRKQALNVTRLLSVNTPDDFMEGLAGLHVNRPELGVAGPHMYPFGGFDKLFDWIGPKLAR